MEGGSTTGYVCGPLSELPADEQRKARRYYREVREIFESVTRNPACIPHEHYDRDFSSEQHEAERRQKLENAWCLVIMNVLPNWRGWEKELIIACRRDIPVIHLCWQGLLNHPGHVSPVLLKNPFVRVNFIYSSADETWGKLLRVLGDLWEQSPANSLQFTLAVA